MKKKVTLFVWLGLLAVLVLLVLNRDSGPQPTYVGFDQFRTIAQSGEIADVRLNGRGLVYFRDLNGQQFVTAGSVDPVLRQKLATDGARSQDFRFNKLDSVLIESAAQLSEPTGKARVRLTLSDSPPVEGEVVWADGSFLKLHRADGQPDIVIAKRQVRLLEALDGTAIARPEEIQADPWAGRPTGTA